MERLHGWALGAGLGILFGVAAATGYFIKQSDALSVSQQPGTLVAQAETPPNVENPIATDERAADSDAPLAYLGMTATRDDVGPKACFRFSAALSPDQTVSDKAFVRVSPDVPFSLQVDGKSLCVIGLNDDAERAVSILPGLTAANGQILQRQVSETITFEAKPAMVGFIGEGIILPRTDRSTLGLKAMNADTIKLTLYRVNHRALFDTSPNAGETVIEGNWSWNNAAWQTRVQIHQDEINMNGPVNEMVEAGYDLEPIIGDHGPGAYIVEIERASDEGQSRPASSWRWLYVTDMALASYRTEKALNVTVRSIATAQTRANVKLTLIARNNEVLAQAETDATGRSKFPAEVLQGTGNLAPKMILAYTGEEDFAALDLSRSPLDLTAYDVTGRQASGPVDAFMYTERGVYRPGDMVHLTSLVRDATANAAFDRKGTLKVRQPDGMVFSESRVSPAQQAGALIRQIRLPETAARGRWTAELDLDGLGQVGSVRFSVEDFMPEQLRLDLRADDRPFQLGQSRSLTVAADFLYGAPGRGLDAEAEARVSIDPNPFSDWTDYHFGHAVETYREQIVPIGQGTTNDSGLFETPLRLEGEAFRSSYPLRMLVTAGVAEPGGRYVRDSLFLPVRLEQNYVGFDPAFDGGYAKRNSPAEIRLIAVDAYGQRVPVSGQLSLIREDYDYHWYRENGRWRYRRDRRDIVLEEKTVTLSADTPYLFSETLDYGEYRVQFQTEDGRDFSYQFGSGWRRTGGDTDAPDRIEMGLSQSQVRPGDALVLSVSAPFDGVGELVIADRDIRTVQTVQIPEGASSIRLPVASDWTSDVYALLTVYTPGSQTQARRAVGLVHIPMDRSNQTLDVTVETPARIRPSTQQDVTIKVAGLDGEAAFMTLAAVDTGILQITDYTPPDPESHYFGKLAFPIDVFDDYARMLAPFSGVDRVGGDTLGGAGLAVVPTRIVSLFEGPIRIRNGQATIPLDVPDFQGELTVMAVAWSETKIGAASTTMIVRDPVTAQLALPRFLAPGDEAVATVALDNVEGEAGTYKIMVSRDGTEISTDQQDLAPGERGETTVAISSPRTGISTYALSIDGPEFTVSREYQLQTRHAQMPITTTRFIKLDVGETVTLDFTQDREGMMAGASDIRVTASYSPGVDARTLLSSLQRYPYGCTEQTVSVAMPLLLSEAFGGIPGMTEDQRRASIQNALDRLVARQGSDGAFGLWSQGDGAASPYLQLYVSDFVLAADAQGFAVSEDVKDRTLAAVRRLSQLDNASALSLNYNFGLSDQNPDYELRAAERAANAFAILARHDRVKKSELLYLERRFGARLRGSITQSQLGFALASLGQDQQASAAYQRAADRMNGSDITYYDSAIRNAAALLSLSENLPEETLNRAMQNLQINNPAALNTHEKAWVLRALAGRRTDGRPFESLPDWTAAGNAASKAIDPDEVALSLTNPDPSPVWLQVTTNGIPAGDMTARSEGAALSKTLYDLNGQRLSAAQISRGERFLIVVEADASTPNEAMWVLADLLPAGVEIETILTPGDTGASAPFAWVGSVSNIDMTEARDDRFIASWRTQSRYDDQKRRLAYIVRATTQGNFNFPGTHLEDMYRPDRFATTPGDRLIVTPPPTL
jgi:hypothetical protein